MANVIANVLTGVALITYDTTGGAASVGVTTELGYTEDGVIVEYTPTVVDIEVEEETFAINRVITKEEITVTCNCAENLEANLLTALAGGTGSPIILDAGALQDFALKIYGLTTGGLHRTIYIPYAHSVGTVAMSYRKGEKTIIPITFKAYKHGVGIDVCTITDA